MQDDMEIIHKFKNAQQECGAGFLAIESCSRPEAEEELGIVFPQSYLDLVSKLKDAREPMQDIVTSYREPAYTAWPEWLVPFFQDGHGNCYCFDTRSPPRDGEYPIVFWDHEFSRDENIARAGRTDASFPEWVDRYGKAEVTTVSSPANRFVEIGCLVLLILLAILAGLGIVQVIGWFRNG